VLVNARWNFLGEEVGLGSRLDDNSILDKILDKFKRRDSYFVETETTAFAERKPLRDPQVVEY
jgi:hypothetical protein